MIRAASYARYSTDLQSARSIADQEALIARHCANRGWVLVARHSDAALSGGTMHRPGLQDLLAAAESAAFDLIVVEELDRLSRDLADLAGIYKRLEFRGVRLEAVHEGTASLITVGLRGLVGQMFRADNAHKVRRGMAGRARSGLTAGGRAYGYRPDPANPGRPQIDPAEAEVVRRIFADFARGDSALAIAQRLSAEGVPPPRGSRAWLNSTLRGWAERGTGLLRNPLYGGQIVWNRVTMLRDPATGKRISRPNPPTDWVTTDAPELRIVPEDLFQAVQALIARRTPDPAERARQRRPQRPLSGLLRCGCCGAGMSVRGTDRSGRVRIECTRHATSRTCPAPRTWYLDTVEGAVMALLRAELDRPDLLKLYGETYNRTRAELAAGEGRERDTLTRKLADAESAATRLLDFVARGVGDADRIARDYSTRCDEIATLKARLSQTPAPLASVALHPLAVLAYKRDLSDLAAALGHDAHTPGTPAITALRRLVESVTITEGAAGEQIITLKGRLRSLIEAPPLRRKLSGGAVVAEERVDRSAEIDALFTLRWAG